ncbi:MAG: type IV pilin protein [Pseudomonadota bacterium]
MMSAVLSRSVVNRSMGGFTLIEVIIVVVVVSILMAIGLPAYENSMQKNRRTDAKAALMEVANKQEQFMLDQGTYTGDMTQLGLGADPYPSEEEYYTVDASFCPGDSDFDSCFLLTATPVAGKAQAKDSRCASFTLNSNGVKGPTASNQNDCW